MIARLRRRHLLLSGACVALAASGLGAAVLVRPPSLRPLPLPAELAALDAAPLPAGAHLLWEAQRLWTSPATIARLYAVVPAGPALLELQPLVPAPPQRAPDALVYWSPSPDSLAEAWLLGTAPARGLRRYPLPEVAQRGGGWLLLWSLGHGALLASAPLPESAPR